MNPEARCEHVSYLELTLQATVHLPVLDMTTHFRSKTLGLPEIKRIDMEDATQTGSFNPLDLLLYVSGQSKT